ncbi:hypothetical protein RSSM_03523 [Rhodopirellula sallentina SM41]|uniref:Uncharacterized protein n=1 Tax=Rhodopirellula sallentina SM41 TaxID=1263870 RepID=M5U0M3_9BACT|nr:hypothetical protein RSSM_03523 [Rhodopirellula sallentina SM41]
MLVTPHLFAEDRCQIQTRGLPRHNDWMHRTRLRSNTCRSNSTLSTQH